MQYKLLITSECSEEHPCDGLGEHAHFKNFGMAFLTLFRIATGDNWNGIMKVRETGNIIFFCKWTLYTSSQMLWASYPSLNVYLIFLSIFQDALRDDCDSSDHCERNCCVDPILAPCFFVIFVLISQFVLVNVVVAVLMKHLEESNKKDAEEAQTEAGNQLYHSSSKLSWIVTIIKGYSTV